MPSTVSVQSMTNFQMVHYSESMTSTQWCKRTNKEKGSRAVVIRGILIEMELGEEDGATRLDDEQCGNYKLLAWELRTGYEIIDLEKNESVNRMKDAKVWMWNE